MLHERSLTQRLYHNTGNDSTSMHARRNCYSLVATAVTPPGALAASRHAEGACQRHRAAIHHQGFNVQTPFVAAHTHRPLV